MCCSLRMLLGSTTETPWGAEPGEGRALPTLQTPSQAPAHPTSRSSMVPGWNGGKALPFGGSFGEYSLNDLEEQPGEREGTWVSRGHPTRTDTLLQGGGEKGRMQNQSSPYQHSPIPLLCPPPSASPAPHPTESSRPPSCRIGPTGSGLSTQDQQLEGPIPIPEIFHWCPEFVSSQLARLWTRHPRGTVQLVSWGGGAGWALSSPQPSLLRRA